MKTHNSKYANITHRHRMTYSSYNIFIEAIIPYRLSN